MLKPNLTKTNVTANTALLLYNMAPKLVTNKWKCILNDYIQLILTKLMKSSGPTSGVIRFYFVKEPFAL